MCPPLHYDSQGLLCTFLQYFGILKAGEALDDHLTTAFEYTYKNSKLSCSVLVVVLDFLICDMLKKNELDVRNIELS